MSKSESKELVPSPEALPGSLVPINRLTSAIGGLLFSIPLGVLATALSVYGLESYGVALFCFLPFCVGLGSALVYGYPAQRSLSSSLGVSQLAILLLGLTIFLFAMEGVICLIMAMPIAMALALMGGFIGWLLASRFFSSRLRANTLVLLVVSMPLFMGFEDANQGQPDKIAVTTRVFIEAAPEVVWEHLIHAVTLPMAQDTLFRKGIAYPTEMRLEGSGVGAKLKGTFTTGPFEVTIDAWDAPSRLAMSVTTHPPTMKEWSIYGDIDAPHIAGYFACESGVIELEEVPGEGTIITGTTHCLQDLGPTRYWSLWSERIIDGLHRHVFEDIRSRAEAAAL